MNCMFLGAYDGYDELVKSLISVFAVQAQEIKKLSVKYDEAELTIMKNVRAGQATQEHLLRRDKASDGVAKVERFVKQTRDLTKSTFRTFSMAYEKQQAQVQEKEVLKVEIDTLRQRNSKLQTLNDSMSNELTTLREERKTLLAKQSIQDEELATLKASYEFTLEENQALKLEKMKREAQQAQQQPTQLTQELEQQINELCEQINSLKTQEFESKQILDEERKQRSLVNEQLDYQRKNAVQLKTQIDEIQRKLIEKDTAILKLKQDIEFLNLQQLSNSDNMSNSLINNEEQSKSVIQEKNQQINQLTMDLQASQATIAGMKDELRRILEQNENLEKVRDNNNQEIRALEREIQQLKLQDSKVFAAPVTVSQSSVNMSTILRDLEDGKNLMEKKNNEIINLKRQLKDQEEQINQLNSQIRISKAEMLKYEQENKDFQAIMGRTSIDKTEQLYIDFDLLLRDSDPVKRSSARNIKNRMEILEKEVLFRQTEAEIKREQLQPYKDKSKALEKENQHLKFQVSEYQLTTNKQNDLIAEQERQLELFRDKISQIQSQPSNKMIKGRPTVAVDNDVLKENNQSCADNTNCAIF